MDDPILEDPRLRSHSAFQIYRPGLFTPVSMRRFPQQLPWLILFLAGCTPVAEPRLPRLLVGHELVRPLDTGAVKVLLVNARLRFVVLDYSLNQLPVFGQRLEVVREGQPVGELKITGPTNGVTTAADIVSGEVRVGDVARPQ